MFRTSVLVAACTAAILASGAFASIGNAASNPTMKACSTQWQAMKTAGTVPAGQKWNDFLKTCVANANTSAAAPVVPAAPVAQAKPVAPAATPVAQATPAAKPTLASKLKKLATTAAAPAVVAAAPAAAPASGGTAGEQSRIQQCGAQWKTAKSSNTVPAGQTWPQFWSACDAHLKAGG